MMLKLDLAGFLVLGIGRDPVGGRSSRGDGDAALALLLHPVHDRIAFMHFAYLVANAGIVKDTLRSGRLTGIDVGDDAEVADFFNGIICHGLVRIEWDEITKQDEQRLGWPRPCDGRLIVSLRRCRCC